jgi:anaerobic C4-dicarboxylate transporter
MLCNSKPWIICPHHSAWRESGLKYKKLSRRIESTEANKKEIKMRKIICVILMLTVLTTMVSCIAVGAGGKKVENQPTLGQQLIDLKNARDEDAISKQEYAELKEKLKKSYD